METLPTNIKPHLVWCERCKTDYTTIDANPKCPVCKDTLITVLYSLLTGERITGVTDVKK